MSAPRAVRVADEVVAARLAHRGIVALESSVLAQGLPVPENAEAARLMQDAVRASGAVPAITAVVRGQIALGLESDELARFLRRDGVHKVSARDLGAAIATARDGATTVAASLAICRLADVPVFATGGIGGVHREPAFDESADLLELSRSRVIVVCAGAKSILDLPATLERLESFGVPVVGYRTDELPGFYTRGTGLPVPARAESAQEIVAIARAHWGEAGQSSAVLVVQPPPADAALDRSLVDEVVAAALREAASGTGSAAIRGAAITPFLLGRIAEATGGASMRANLALLEANAALAGEVASHFAAAT